MDYLQVIEKARANQKKNDEVLAAKNDKKFGKNNSKGVNPAAVNAFLKKKREQEQSKDEEARKKKAELMRLRVEQNNMGKVKRMLTLSTKKLKLTEIEGSETDPRLKKNQDKDDKKITQQQPKSVSTDVKSKSGQLSSASHKKSGIEISSKPSSIAADNGKPKTCDPPEMKKSKPSVSKPKPPPLSYKDILRLAVEQQHKPVRPEDQKKNEEEKQSSSCPDGLMSQEEKDRMARRKSKEYQDWLKYGKPLPPEFLDLARNSQQKRKRKLQTESESNAAYGNENRSTIGASTKLLPEQPAPARKPSPAYDQVNERIVDCSPSKPNPVKKANGHTGKPNISGLKRTLSQPKAPGNGKYPDLDDEDDPEESDEDGDDDMDDFIDDTEEADVSKEIRAIFGYDRRRFVDDDDEDDAAMEASYSQVMMEEKRSAKLGLKEDLEDIRREEEEKKRKMLQKKKKLKY